MANYLRINEIENLNVKGVHDFLLAYLAIIALLWISLLTFNFIIFRRFKLFFVKPQNKIGLIVLLF